MPDSDWYWITVVCSASSVAIAANGLALLVFWARPALRTLANRFVINLLAINLCCALVLGPLLVVDQVRWFSPGVALCAISEGSSAFCCLSAVLGIFLIATDQYLAVTDPLRYHARVSRARSLLMIIAQWTIAAIFGVAAGAVPQPSPSVWNSCKYSDLEDSASYSVYKITFACIYIGFAVLCIIAMCLMYSCISLAARRSARPPGPPPPLMSLNIDPLAAGDIKKGDECVGLLLGCEKKSSEPSEPNAAVGGLPLYELRLAPSLKSVLLDVNKPYPSPLCLKFTHESDKKVLSHDDIYKISQTAPANGLKTVRSSPNFGSMDCRPVTPPPRCASYMNSLRCRISNASLFRYGEESRAARISALVIFLALASQFPAAALQAAPVLGIAPLVALCLGACISPFLFAYRSRRVKKELFSMCRRNGKESYTGNVLPLRRTSSLSTEQSWRSTKVNSSQAALRLLKTLENDARSKPAPVFANCPPGKSILKRVRAQSFKWGRRTQRCKFSTDATPNFCNGAAAEPRMSSSSAASSNVLSDTG